MRSGRVFLVLVVGLLCSGWSCADLRVALVIGNGSYDAAKPLPQAAASAAAVAEALQAMGFAVASGTFQANASLNSMVEQVFVFGEQARGASEVVVYFAGYGVGIEGVNYLIPADAKARTASDLPAEAIRLDSFIGAFRPVAGRLTVIVDAVPGFLKQAPGSQALTAMKPLEGVTVMMGMGQAGGDAAAAGPSSFTAAILAKLQALPEDVLGDHEIGQDAALDKLSDTNFKAVRDHWTGLSEGGRFELEQEACKAGQTPGQYLADKFGTPTPGPADDEEISRDIVTDDQGSYEAVTVFYATDRRGSGGGPAGESYGSEHGEIAYGSCLVSIPEHHSEGVLEGPDITSFEFSADPHRHIVLLETERQSASAFFRDVAARVNAEPGHSAFIFVHGFNVSFQDAARRTAQMAHDLAFKGAPVFFSWPSQASYFGYAADETSVKDGATDLAAFLKDFIDRSTADSIYLIAHSMGNRALTSAVSEVLAADPIARRKVKEIVLAAPDIDAVVFKHEIVPSIEGGVPVTLYASSNDWALKASRWIHSATRAGDMGSNPTIMNGVATIDASDVDVGLMGHTYFSDSPSILSDIRAIFGGVADPGQRQHLKSIEIRDGQYWKFIAAP